MSNTGIGRPGPISTIICERVAQSAEDFTVLLACLSVLSKIGDGTKFRVDLLYIDIRGAYLTQYLVRSSVPLPKLNIRIYCPSCIRMLINIA